jgi:hypothetical protein
MGTSRRREDMLRSMKISAATSARTAHCVETCRAWNERLRAGADPDPAPLLGTALAAGFRFLQVTCLDCQTIGEVDLATVDRHPEASLSSLVPSMKCKGCPNSIRMPRLTGLSIAPLRSYVAR